MEYDFRIDNEFGIKRYYKKGTETLHREDGPAIEYIDGTKFWYINGQIHRGDGPAVEYANGYKAWYVNGKTHRIDGTAVEWGNRKEWWINGDRLSKQKEAILNQWWDKKNGL